MKYTTKMQQRVYKNELTWFGAPLMMCLTVPTLKRTTLL